MSTTDEERFLNFDSDQPGDDLVGETSDIEVGNAKTVGSSILQLYTFLIYQKEDLLYHSYC